eukprot:7387656-Prymnesium_polylepis.1
MACEGVMSKPWKFMRGAVTVETMMVDSAMSCGPRLPAQKTQPVQNDAMETQICVIRMHISRDSARFPARPSTGKRAMSTARMYGDI